MGKMTIDVDLGEWASEWDAAAIRPPKNGDDFLDSNGDINRCLDDAYGVPSIIVRRKIKWPSWCAAAAICKDQSGVVFAYAEVPSRGCSSWSTDGYWSVLDPRIVDFQLPDDYDWTIPIINPNYKEPSGS